MIHYAVEISKWTA